MKKNIKKIATIILILFIFIFMLNNKVKAEDDSNSSNESDFEHYTIEDIVFNRVPILDVNFFTDTAGGQTLQNTSLLAILRKTVAVWYVSFRNLVAILLVILLIYAGIRMSISTVAGEKAKYKQIIVGWLKSVILLFTMHYIMIFILNLNSTFINLLYSTQSGEDSIYNTIRTRAYDIRFSVGVPATIMYIVLVFFFIRFTWIYIKRLFTITILIIIAPFMAAKYAIDSASGKNSQVISKWIYEFSTNVGIQSIHALLYTLLMGIAINLARTNIAGFILALVFMNLMLKSDELVLKIFNFSSSSMQSIKKPFKKEEDLAGMFVTYKLAKSFYKGTINGVKNAGRFVGLEAKGLYDNGMDKLDAQNGKDNRKSVNEFITSKLNNIDTKVGTALTSMNDHTIKNPEIGNAIKDITALRIKSRQGGEEGKNAKKAYKRKIKHYTKNVSGNFKFITSEIGGLASLAFAIPSAVMDPKAGMLMGIKGYETLKKNGTTKDKRQYTSKEKLANIATLGTYGKHEEMKEKSKKENDKINKAIKHILTADTRLEEIEKEINNLPAEEKNEAIEIMDKINQYNTNRYAINKFIKENIRENNIGSIDETTINDIIREALEFTGTTSELTNEQRRALASKVRFEIENNSQSQNTYASQAIADVISEQTVNEVTGNRFTPMVSKLNEIKDHNEQAIDEANDEDEADRLAEKGVKNTNKFIQDLNK